MFLEVPQQLACSGVGRDKCATGEITVEDEPPAVLISPLAAAAEAEGFPRRFCRSARPARGGISR